MITEALTDAPRQDVLNLFLDVFSDIAPNAVPMTHDDWIYRPVVAQYRDEETGQLLGAALTCRSQLAAGSVTMAKMGAALPPQMDYTSVLDKHSELDLMAVRADARGRGIGGQLLAYLEDRLRERGVRVWFGNATKDLETRSLRSFYTGHGFTVLEEGQPLPALLGRQWHPGDDPRVAFHFYKQLTKNGSGSAGK